jgi:hypothetical protein
MGLIKNVGSFPILSLCVIIFTLAPAAQSAVLRCDALSARIDRNLQRNGVRNYKLEVLPISEKSGGKYEGRCDGGIHKVVFFRNVAAATTLSSSLNSLFVLAPIGSSEPEWQTHLKWCWNNFTTDPGMTNCVDKYIDAGAQNCIVGGGRKCLIGQAAYLATHGQCAAGFGTALVCECNNDGARQKIFDAGPNAVCSYVKSIVPGGDLLKYAP